MSSLSSRDLLLSFPFPQLPVEDDIDLSDVDLDDLDKDELWVHRLCKACPVWTCLSSPMDEGKTGTLSYWTLLKTKTHNVSLLTSLQSFAMRRDRDLNHGRFSFALQASFLFDRLTVWMLNRIVISLFPVQLYPLHIASELGLFAVFPWNPTQPCGPPMVSIPQWTMTKTG